MTWLLVEKARAGQFGSPRHYDSSGTQRIDVADRPNSEIDRFHRYGQYLSTLKCPWGSLPCDIDF